MSNLGKHMRTQKIIDRFEALARQSTKDSIPVEMYELAIDLVDQGHDDLIYQLMKKEDLPEEAAEAIALTVMEAGYRLHWEERGRVQHVIPFAMLVSICVPEGETQAFRMRIGVPSALQKALRKALGLPSQARLFLDPTLHPWKIEEWGQESTIRPYLKQLVTKQSDPTVRLASFYTTAPQTEWISTPTGGLLGYYVLCGIVTSSSGKETESLLFDCPEPPNLKSVSAYLEDDLFPSSLQERATIEVWDPLEWWEILERGSLLSHMTKIQSKVCAAPSLPEEGESVMYLSVHNHTITEPCKEGDLQIDEVRIALFASDRVGQLPLFTYAWEVDHQHETSDGVFETIQLAAQDMKASLIAIDELFPLWKCKECGERSFMGPEGRLAHSHQRN